MVKITEEQVMEKLKQVYDLEIGYDIVSLGFIYKVSVDDNNNIHILNTLTTAACPLSGFLVEEIKNKVKTMEGVGDVEVELTFDPPWTPDMATEEVRNALGI